MKNKSILFCLVFAFCAITSITVYAQAVNTQDSLALVDLYNSTNGPNWVDHTNWLSGPVTTWYGITIVDARVSKIVLNSNNLSGNLPSGLGNLNNLDSLNLVDNSITGLPPEFGNLASLQYLELSFNQITTLPPEFGNLTNLKFLDLGANKIARLPPEFGNLKNLKTLSLAGNQITALPPELGNLKNLKTLSLSSNQIRCLPPELGNLGSLQKLWLDNNQISVFPPQLRNLASLRVLVLNNNQISVLPAELGNLNNLRFLILNDNRISVLPEFANLRSLQRTELYNNHLTFDGLEHFVQDFPNTKYSPQAIIHLHQNSDALSVSAGGTPSNNTYKWFRITKTGKTLVAIITKDSIFHPSENGKYFTNVTNSIATKLTLKSDTFNYVVPAVLKTEVTTSSGNALRKQNKSFLLVYPNPAKDILHVQTNGKATLTLTDQSGKILFTKSINGKDEINVANLPAGLYYLRNNEIGAVQKIIIAR